MNQIDFTARVMTLSRRRCHTIWLLLVALLVPSLALGQNPGHTPPVGTKAPEFTLRTPSGTPVSLESDTSAGETVLIVLRGYPGYQCPFCVKQVHDFVEHSAQFRAKQARVLLVYPGPHGDLDQHAREFLAQQQAGLPGNVQLVVDPDYKMTDLYGLRWDAPHETAYPATFVLHQGGIISFEKISHEHGNRTTAEDVLGNL